MGKLTRGRGWRPNAPRPMDATRKQKFLDALAEHGIVGEAARAASLHSHRGCLATFYREREADPEFAKAWDEALDLARASIEYELHRRAVEGVEKPVFYLGKEIGSVTEYSDSLLLARIRKLDPEYRPQQRIEHAGTVKIKPLGLDELSAEQRKLLRGILELQAAKDADFSIVAPALPLDNANSEAPAADGGAESDGDTDAEDPSP